MERFFDHAEINHGRLYPNIETLVGYDLMDKSEIDGRTNAHDVTDEGRRLVRNARARDEQWVDGVLDRSQSTAVADGGQADE
jgi:DNA-binding PadR family transcriptional regulator